MDKKYPLYPRLNEEGEKQAQLIMDSFKPRIKALVDEMMSDLYCDVVYHIESDSWTNYRNELMNGLKGYSAGASVHQHDFKELRQAIYAKNKDAVNKDLNKDLLQENEKLKAEIDNLYNMLNDRV